MKRKSFFRKGNYVLIMFIVALISVAITDVPNVYAAIGAIYTSKEGCTSPINANAYNTDDIIYIRGKGFSTGTEPWSIRGNSGGSSCDSDTTIADGQVTISSDSCTCSRTTTNLAGDCTCSTELGYQFCFPAYKVQSDDCGVYRYAVDGKNDNYHVEGGGGGTSILETTKNAPSSVAPGSDITYTIKVRNTGDATTGTIHLEDVLPGNVTCKSYSSGDGWTCSGCEAGSGTVNCTNGTLAAGVTSDTLTIVVTPTTTGTFNNSACATQGTEPQTPACAYATTTITEAKPAVVPTMTEWGIILFIILAGLGSIYYLRRQRKV